MRRRYLSLEDYRTMFIIVLLAFLGMLTFNVVLLISSYHQDQKVIEQNLEIEHLEGLIKQKGEDVRRLNDREW